MHRLSRKLTALFLAAAFVCLAGCTGNSATPAPTAAPATAAATATPAPTAAATAAPAETPAAPDNPYGEHVNISWVPQNDHEVPQDADAKVAIEEMFNWTIDAIYMDRNNETELLNMRLAAGEIPDVLRVGNDVRHNQLVAEGVLRPMPVEDIQKYAPTMYQATIDMFSVLHPNIWEMISVDGVLYSVPIGNLNGTYSVLPIWRDDWLAEAGWEGEPPVKWDDVVEMFRYFTFEDPDGDGTNNTYGLGSTGMSYIQRAAFGGGAFEYFDTVADGAMVPNILVPGKFKDYVQTMADFYKEGLIEPEYTQGENEGQYWALSVKFCNGILGFACPGSYYHTNGPLFEGQPNPSSNYTPFYELNPDGSYTHGKTITGPTGFSYVPTGVARPGARIVIGRNIDEAAWIRFLQFHEAMFTDYEVYRLVVDGVRGVNFDDLVLPDGRIANNLATQDELDAMGRPNANKGLYTNGFGFIAENCWDFLKRRDIALYDYADANATPGVLGGTPFANVIWAGMTETAQQKTDMDTLTNQNVALFITGQRPMEQWDAFITELYAVGMQAWIDECNQWYNDFTGN